MSKLVTVTDEIKMILKKESGRKTYDAVADELGVSKTWVMKVSSGKFSRIREKLADRVFAMGGIIISQPENSMTAEQLNRITNEAWFKRALRKSCLNYKELEPEIQKLRDLR